MKNHEVYYVITLKSVSLKVGRVLKEELPIDYQIM